MTTVTSAENEVPTPGSDARSSRTGWTSSVGVLVAALAALPLTGAALFATAEIRRVGIAEDRASAVVDDVSSLVDIMTLRMKVLEERNWVLATAAIENVGISAEEATELTGVDIAAELSEAQDDVDQTVVALGDAELVTDLEHARATPTESDRVYLAIGSELDAESTAVVRDLQRSAGALPGGGDLIDTLRMLETATDASQSVALQLTTYFAIVFPAPDDLRDHVDTLVSLRVRHLDAIARIRRNAPIRSGARSAVRTIDTSMEIVRFDLAIDSLVNAHTHTGPSPSVDLFADTSRTVPAFQGGAASVVAHVDIIRGAALDVEEAARMISDTAQSETRRSLGRIGVLFLASIVFVVAVGSFIVFPLRNLANQARRVRDGLEAEGSKLRGPREIREADVAIREASAHLGLAQRQAHALAEGELAHPALSETAPGTLGRALHQAVQTLASSMAESERSACELRETQEQLLQARKLESIGQLAAGVAHEINTPIQYLSDNTTFLHDSFDDMLVHFDRLVELSRRLDPLAVDDYLATTDLEFLRAEIPGALDGSKDGLNRVSEIVRAMKDFSHPGSELADTDLNRAISSTATVSRNEWKYVADLNLDLDASLPLVRCHEGQFKQVMVNLIVNAAHAIDDSTGSERGAITVATRPKGSRAQISVSDNGCGMTSDVKERIFDPFFTTKAVGRGTGQGLALAHRIVTNHGGTIQVDSRVGAGTTFLIEVPLG